MSRSTMACCSSISCSMELARAIVSGMSVVVGGRAVRSPGSLWFGEGGGVGIPVGRVLVGAARGGRGLRGRGTSVVAILQLCSRNRTCLDSNPVSVPLPRRYGTRVASVLLARVGEASRGGARQWLLCSEMNLSRVDCRMSRSCCRNTSRVRARTEEGGGRPRRVEDFVSLGLDGMNKNEDLGPFGYRTWDVRGLRCSGTSVWFEDRAGCCLLR